MRNPRLGFKEKLEAFEIVTLRLVGLFPLHCVRVWALRAFGADVSRDAVVYHGFLVRAARGSRIGKRCNVGEGAVLDGRGGLVRGDDVNLSSDVHIWTAQHDWNSRDFAHVRASVEIECRVWLGPRVTVLPGASIGEGAVVAAGAVVSGRLEPRGLYGGVPARRLADRTADLQYHLPSPRGKLWWWW